MGKVMFLKKGDIHTAPSLFPSNYTKLAYIESSGTQYIDTGFKPNQDTKIVLDMQITSVAVNHLAMFYGVDEASKYFAMGKAGTSSYNIVSYYGSNYQTTSSETSSSILERRTIIHDKNVVSYGSSTYTFPAATFQSTKNAFLFDYNTTATYVMSKMRLYSCQIYDNGILVRDYVPCVTDGGDIGLYDMVNRVFYGNSGSGTFIGAEAA